MSTLPKCFASVRNIPILKLLKAVCNKFLCKHHIKCGAVKEKNKYMSTTTIMTTTTTSTTTTATNRSLSRDDSLEYFIKFPTPNFRQDTDGGGESDYVFVYNETNVPIVILLGWAGCQDKYLMKYSRIYEDRGYMCGFICIL